MQEEYAATVWDSYTIKIQHKQDKNGPASQSQMCQEWLQHQA